MALFRLTTSNSAWARSGSETQSAEDASSVMRTLVIANRSNLSLDIAPKISFYIAEPSSTVQLKQTRRSETMICVRVGSTRAVPVGSSARQKYRSYLLKSLQRRTLFHVPRTGVSNCNDAQFVRLFDHLIDAGEQRWRTCPRGRSRGDAQRRLKWREINSRRRTRDISTMRRFIGRATGPTPCARATTLRDMSLAAVLITAHRPDA